MTRRLDRLEDLVIELRQRVAYLEGYFGVAIDQPPRRTGRPVRREDPPPPRDDPAS